MHPRSYARCGRTVCALLELLETRALMTLPSTLQIPLNKDLDQFGDQIVTVQGFESADGTSATGAGFGIFDTGASAITFSPDDASIFEFYDNPIPIKNVGGAEAEGIGGTITGDVSEPVTIVADGLHASELTFDDQGFPLFDFDFSGAAATENIQAFVGTEVGSPDLPTITGTPLLEPSDLHPNGLAALVDMTGQVLDFSDIAPGLVLPFPDVHFVDPTTASVDTKDGVTDPVVLDLHPYGPDNYADPGDEITSSPNVTLQNVSATYGLDSSAVSVDNQTFLFDTGAQISVISTAMATALGLDLAHPETTITVQGVGGTEDVPGFTLAKLDVPRRDGGILEFTDIPVYVLDVAPDIDGIFGMNALDTASQILFNPYDPTGASVTFTFLTDPDRGDPGSGDDGGGDGDILLSGGIPFGGAFHGQSLPTFGQNLSPGGTPLSTTTSLVVSQPSPVIGQDETLTAIVSAGLMDSGRLVTFTDTFNGVTRTLGTAALDSQNHATITTHTLEAGLHSLKASYAGQPATGAGTQFNRPSTSSATPLTVSHPHVTISATPTPATITLGQSVTLSASIAALESTTAKPSGTVTFYDGATKLGTSQLDGSGKASLAVPGLGVGTHTIAAAFTGSSVFLDNKTSTTVTVNPVNAGPQPTTTSLFASAGSSVFGQLMTLTANVTAAPGHTPTGSIVFYDGGTAIASATLSGGVALATNVVLASVGTHSLTASYTGDAANILSTSTAIGIAVSQAQTKTIVTVSPNHGKKGSAQGSTLTVTVSALSPSTAAVSGEVLVKIGKATRHANLIHGVAKLTLSRREGKAHPKVTAKFLGDSTFQASTSASIRARKK